MFREITDEQKISVACPYCNAEAVVDLNPFRQEKRAVFRRENPDEQSLGMELQLPDILPTQKPD